MLNEKHPDQPIEVDDAGVFRFKKNAIVRFLVDAGPFTLTQLAALPVSNDDFNQFAMLLGYTVAGFGELSYADNARVERADEEVTRLRERLVKKAGTTDA